MDEAERIVLQRHLRQLAADIMVTEDLLGSLFQNGIFERNMIEIIKSEKTATEQIYKLLEMLPKRGPHAFESFVNTIQSDYPWLAAMLQSSLREEQMKWSKNIDLCDSCGTNPRAGTDAVDGSLTRQNSEMSIVPVIIPDPDIKTRVGTFVHKQFGHSKRISEKDKKAIEKWVSEQLQKERKKVELASVKSIETTETGCDPIMDDRHSSSAIEAKLFQFHSKLKAKTKRYSSNSEGDSDSPCHTPDSDSTSELVTLDIIQDQIDTLLDAMNERENEISQCFHILGEENGNKSLKVHIQELQSRVNIQEKLLALEKQKYDSMLSELYEHSKQLNKLEQLRQQHRSMIEENLKEINKLKQENTQIQEKCNTLEMINKQHAEKEMTIENLKRIVKDLQGNRTDRNGNYLSPARYRSDSNGPRTGRTMKPATGRRGSNAELYQVSGLAKRPSTKIMSPSKRKIYPYTNRY